MREDGFPGFQLVYRQLRKEGVAFPVRDANERMLMGNLGVDSPMFDYVEELAGRTVGGEGVGTKGGKRNKERGELDRRARELQEKDALEALDNMNFEDNDDDAQLSRAKVDASELEIIKSSLQILEDIQERAESLDEMKSEVATDIYQTCLMMRRRVARIVQAKSFANVDIQHVTELLEIIDFIDRRLEAYKKRYLKFKAKALRDIEKRKKKILEEE